MTRLWLDAHDYGAQLLRGGDEPWRTPSSLGPFYGELAGLLRPWRLVVPVEPLLMSSLPRSGDTMDCAGALDRLVGSAGFAQSLATGLATLAHSPAAPLCAPRLPGPSRLGSGLEDEDALDDVVAALGHILRQIAGAALSGTILLDEPEAEALGSVSPLLRIAEHAGVTLRLIGRDIATADWDALPEGADDRENITVIPADAQPEATLTRLAASRQGDTP
ncbi:hypothetical protein [Sphingosinicella soli]|uniref:Uncharacterized protein n=1 Tax=Sphingosinicella soli TaxID=333708 RepID=A0A7W7F5G9_9SPHN|nr:hypothetical protein [Sphingosinicella soli]MBB4630679.1 hypothetical protein [Sphingosinicella soli]